LRPSQLTFAHRLSPLRNKRCYVRTLSLLTLPFQALRAEGVSMATKPCERARSRRTTAPEKKKERAGALPRRLRMPPETNNQPALACRPCMILRLISIKGSSGARSRATLREYFDTQSD